MNKVVLRQQAEDRLRHDLQQGERIAAGSAVTSDPSRWGAGVVLKLDPSYPSAEDFPTAAYRH